MGWKGIHRLLAPMDGAPESRSWSLRKASTKMSLPFEIKVLQANLGETGHKNHTFIFCIFLNSEENVMIYIMVIENLKEEEINPWHNIVHKKSRRVTFYIWCRLFYEVP